MTSHLQKIDIDLLVQGDHEQWKRLVNQSSPIVFSVIRKTLASAGRDTGEAQDILQELFVKICARNFRLLKRYDPQKAKLTTWLAVIARNMAIDHLRRNRHQYVDLDEIPDKDAKDPFLEPDRERILLSFDVLPPRQMMVMKLLYERDMDVKEVAEFMGISTQSVRSMRHKAIGKLRKIIGGK